MKGRLSIIYFSFPLIFFYSIINYAQESADLKGYYNWFDTTIGIENTVLFDGVRYFEKYRTLKGDHKFYQSSQFTRGEIEYDGQPFYDIDLKYDIYEDAIIANLKSKTTTSIIQLNKNRIDNFKIYNKTFIKVMTEPGVFGFYETIYSDANLELYKKYFKVMKSYIKNQNAFYNTFKNREAYILNYANTYNKFTSKSDLKKIFTNQKKEINSYYRTNKSLRKTNNDLFLQNLAKEISSRTTSKTISSK